MAPSIAPAKAANANEPEHTSAPAASPGLVHKAASRFASILLALRGTAASLGGMFFVELRQLVASRLIGLLVFAGLAGLRELLRRSFANQQRPLFLIRFRQLRTCLSTELQDALDLPERLLVNRQVGQRELGNYESHAQTQYSTDPHDRSPPHALAA